MGDFQAALTDLDEAVVKSREAGQKQLLAFALNGRSLALAGLSRIDESTRDYEESIQLCPTNAWAYYNRGIAMHRRGDDVAAKKQFELALAANSPSLTKRKRERAQALVRKFDERISAGIVHE
jgi:tetratricopeptide (TPR) repeat protein